MAQCTATSKRTGERCRARAITGRNTCRHHGGKSLVGPASPAWKDGRHSSVLPKRLLESYRESLGDEDRLVLNAEIALLDARIRDLLLLVDTGESGRLLSELQKQWQDFEAADAARDKVAASKARHRVGQLIREGVAEWSAWTDVITLVERRRKLVESERKRLVQARQVVTTEQALALLGLLVQAVQQHVRDDVALRAISAEYARLVGRSGDQPAGATAAPS